MKITKRQLMRIIKEEKAKILREARPWPTADQPPSEFEENSDLYVNLSHEQEVALDRLEDALKACLDAGVKWQDIMDTASALVDPEKMV
tara:strand:+ start:197 stop:463 length:267 start_codon:yes stop_codon:yes gene_type:complete